jgi:hypothetical protein
MPPIVSLSCTGICGEDRTSSAGSTGTLRCAPRPPPGKINFGAQGRHSPTTATGGGSQGKGTGVTWQLGHGSAKPSPTPPRPRPDFCFEIFGPVTSGGGCFLSGGLLDKKRHRRNFGCRVPTVHIYIGGVKGTSPGSVFWSGADSTNESRARGRGRGGWPWRLALGARWAAAGRRAG